MYVLYYQMKEDELFGRSKKYQFRKSTCIEERSIATHIVEDDTYNQIVVTEEEDEINDVPF